VSNLLDLKLGIILIVSLGIRLEVHDRHTSIDVGLENTGLGFKLLGFDLFVVDLLLLLEACLHQSLDSLLSILVQLLNLTFKSLFVILILLVVLALDDLLSLLGNSVHLNVQSSLLKIINFLEQPLILEGDSAQIGLVLLDLLKQLDLFVSLLNDCVILLTNDVLLNEDSILVISGYRKLRHLDLS
jgi:hypothetical protein